MLIVRVKMKGTQLKIQCHWDRGLKLKNDSHKSLYNLDIELWPAMYVWMDGWLLLNGSELIFYYLYYYLLLLLEIFASHHHPNNVPTTHINPLSLKCWVPYYTINIIIIMTTIIIHTSYLHNIKSSHEDWLYIEYTFIHFKLNTRKKSHLSI